MESLCLSDCGQLSREGVLDGTLGGKTESSVGEEGERVLDPFFPVTGCLSSVSNCSGPFRDKKWVSLFSLVGLRGDTGIKGRLDQMASSVKELDLRNLKDFITRFKTQLHKKITFL